MRDKIRKILEKRTIEITVLTVVLVLAGAFVQASDSGILDSGNSDDLVAEYRFDTGGGETAYDTSGSNDGTLTNGPRWVSGIKKGAMSFEGSNHEYVISSSNVEVSESGTLEGWIKGDLSEQVGDNIYPFGLRQVSVLGPSGSSSGRSGLIARKDGNNHYWGWGDQNIYDGKWHHYVVTWDNNDVELYLDGEQIGSPKATNGNIPVGEQRELIAGEAWNPGGYGPHTGKIDNWRYYSTDLNLSQIRSNYNTGSWRIGSTTDETDPDKVLEMNFQHQNSSHVYDTSGYDNHGQPRNGASQENAVNCKVGRCYDFDGNDDYMAISNYHYESDTLSNLTVSSWVKANSDGIIASFDRNEYWRFEIGGDAADSGHVGMSFDGDGGQVDGFDSSTQVADGKWHHVAFTFNQGEAKLFVDGRQENSINSGSVIGTGGIRYGFIGVGSEAETFDGSQGPQDYFDGEIDWFKIYNKSLSHREIIEKTEGLSSNGAVLDMRFNEGGGDHIEDYSGNNNHGKLRNGPNWSNGMKGGSLKFDGSNDHATVADKEPLKYKGEGMTVSGWYYETGDGNGEIVSKPWNGMGDYNYRLGKSGSNQLYFRVQGNETVITIDSGPVAENQWHHFTAVLNNPDYRLYIDGDFEASGTKQISSWVPTDDGDDNKRLSIGTLYPYGDGWSGNVNHAYKGRIDRLKIFPYAISESKAEEVYSEGKPLMTSNSNMETGLEDGLVISHTFDRIEECGQSDTVSCPSGVTGELAVDESGEANHGDLIDNPAEENAAECRVGSCLEFNGGGSAVGNGDIFDYSVNNSFTISTWLKLPSHPSTSDGNAGVLSRGTGSSGYGFMNAWRNGEPDFIQFLIRNPDTGNSDRTAFNDVNKNEWYHLTGVHDSESNTLSLYIDGKKVDESGVDIADFSTSQDFFTVNGGHISGGGTDFAGTVDSPRVFNRTLTQEEIWELYTRGRDRSSSGEMAGPVGQWRMAQGGKELYDVAGDNDGEFNSNLLDNSGFESGDDSTGNMNRIITNYAGYSEVNQEDSKSGKYVGKHVKTGEDDQWSAVEWDLNSLESGKSYDFGAWYKCSGNVNSDFSVGIANGTGWDRVERIDLGDYTCDDKWRFTSAESDSLPSNIEDTNRVRFRWAYSTSQGEMYVDDMYLRESDAHWVEDPNRGKVLDFDGSDDYVDVSASRWNDYFGDSADVDTWTTTAWVKVDDLNQGYQDGTAGAIVGQRYGTSTVPLGIREDGALFVDLDDSRGASPESSDTIEEGKWYHVAATYSWSDNLSSTPYGTSNFYINGADAGTDTNDDDSAASTSSELYIGRDARYNMHLDGKLDDVRIYPYALNDRQVKKVMNSGSTSIG